MQTLSTRRAAPAVRPPAVAYRLASDARLARLAAAGSEGAMAAIFERHHQALHRYCYSILGNGHDAADALQNAMVKALRALPGESREIALRPWLYRIAHNEAISLLRARRADSDLDAAAHVGDPAAAGAIESRARLRSLTEDLGELTERQRASLLMRELGGLEFTDIGAALGASAPAAKQSVYEARCALHAMEEGRAMDCETVRRALSDGDRRTLRGMRLRGHLRDCGGCRDFERALRARPAQLTAMIPPLPLAAGAAMLHGIIGGGGTGGGGLLAGLTGTAKATTGISVGAKAAAVAAVSVSVAGGTVYVVPNDRPAAAGDRGAPRAGSAPAASPPAPVSTAVLRAAAAAQGAGGRPSSASALSRPAMTGGSDESATPGRVAAGRADRPAAGSGATPRRESARKPARAASTARRAAVTKDRGATSAARKRELNPARVGPVQVPARGAGAATSAPAVEKPGAAALPSPPAPAVTPGTAAAPGPGAGAGGQP